MKILFLAIGDESVASSRVRVYSYLPYLSKKGFKVFILHYTSSWQCKKILTVKKQNIVEKIVSKLYSVAIILSLFIFAPFFDVIYVQKVLLSKFTSAVLKVLNSNIIFDFDDAIYLYRNIDHLLKNAASVIVSNKYLKEFASRHNSRTYELISPVEVNNRSSLKRDIPLTLGWIGSYQTSKYLYPFISVFRSLKDKFENLNIEFMGAERNKYFESLDIKIVEWSIKKEKKYLQRIDIGIMPLIDDDLSRGKGGYKLLQYMAVGIPCVASPVGINKEIVKDGITGFLASSKEEWLEKFTILLENRELRRLMGEQGRLRAKKYYSYEANLPKLVNILKKYISTQ